MSDLYPDKFTPIERTVVGESALLLGLLRGRAISIGQLFVEFRDVAPTTTYDAFALALTFLYGAGAVTHRDQIVTVP
ncbi:MAG: hypothetical protein PHU75_00915 [Candidatus Nanopelagicales bacterium]|nr:hypothetical protein [Candidatus Nanopelagicales bacterium]